MPQIPVMPILTACFTAFFFPLFLNANEAEPIITEDNYFIQSITTEDLSEWPGVSGPFPANALIEAGRLWLVWPEVLISLQTDGTADQFTLLSMFTTSAFQQAEWTPDNGITDSEGIWKLVHSENPSAKKELIEIFPYTAQKQKRRWPLPLPDSFYAAQKGALAVFSRSSVYLIPAVPSASARPAQARKLLDGLPPLTLTAASSSGPLLAWRQAGNSRLKVFNYKKDSKPRALTLPKEITQNIQSLNFAADTLVCGTPGKIYIVSPGNHSIHSFTHALIPRFWYRISGNENALLIFSPQTGKTLFMARQPSQLPSRFSADFSLLLAENTLNAGNYLEKAGLYTEAEAFYAWALNLVRSERSRSPLSEQWPSLEKTLNERRTKLRESGLP